MFNISTCYFHTQNVVGPYHSLRYIGVCCNIFKINLPATAYAINSAQAAVQLFSNPQLMNFYRHTFLE